MNRKGNSLLLAMAMISMGGFGGIPSEPIKKDRKLSQNEKRKCFNIGCNNLRSGKLDLFCSKECEKQYREENKNT